MIVYVLLIKVMIEDYYSTYPFLGVFSSIEKAEDYIDQREAEHKEELLNSYESYCQLCTPEACLAKLEKEKVELETNLALKQEGSNKWKSIRSTLDRVIGEIEKKYFPKPKSFQSWKGSVRLSFCRDNYRIKMIHVDGLLSEALASPKI